MNDRELLQLAAKAAGYTLTDHYDVEGRYWPWCHELVQHWCPLVDDGDALRLAVKLSMFDTRRLMEIRAELTCADPSKSDEEIMRRAITMCAAEIGRRM